jgi:hypothetical protein
MGANKVRGLTAQFALQMQCAKNAGIYDNCFLAFGSLLGYVRERGFIGHDNDMDIGILADNLTVKQINKYVAELLKPSHIPNKLAKFLKSLNLEYLDRKTGRPKHPRGLYAYREHTEINVITGKLFWTTIRTLPRSAGYKCCNWFMFEHKGYMYHHKGEDSKVKGLPTSFVSEIGPEVEFLGTKVHIPKNAGACLDFWYPDWKTSRSAVSKSEGQLLKVVWWDDPNKWEVIKYG